jgi:hypothetical protein
VSRFLGAAPPRRDRSIQRRTLNRVSPRFPSSARVTPRNILPSSGGVSAVTVSKIPSRRMADQTRIPNPPEQVAIDAAREELDVLDNLSAGVSAHISDLSKRPQFQGKVDNTELALHEHRYARLKAYEELAHSCYGRTVNGTELDEDNHPRGSFTFRITQANVGYPEQGCFVIARNSALASQLVTAQPGDEREVVTPARERLFDVSEVRTFDGPVSLRSPNQEPNFRLM